MDHNTNNQEIVIGHFRFTAVLMLIVLAMLLLGGF
jgi:hypothetical protein